MTSALIGRAILIVAEPGIASDLGRAFDAAGATSIATDNADHAMQLAKHVVLGGAVLDDKVCEGAASTLAITLAQHGVVTILYTGTAGQVKTDGAESDAVATSVIILSAMDRLLSGTVLDDDDRRLDVYRRLVAEQETHVAQLDLAGHSTEFALRTLRSFRDTLDLVEQALALLRGADTADDRSVAPPIPTRGVTGGRTLEGAPMRRGTA
jgi:hypothetical protein